MKTKAKSKKSDTKVLYIIIATLAIFIFSSYVQGTLIKTTEAMIVLATGTTIGLVTSIITLYSSFTIKAKIGQVLRMFGVGIFFVSLGFLATGVPSWNFIEAISFSNTMFIIGYIFAALGGCRLYNVVKKLEYR